MARRKRTEAPVAGRLPEHLRRCFVAEWVDLDRERPPATLVTDEDRFVWLSVRAWGRWDSARREFAAEHGLDRAAMAAQTHSVQPRFHLDPSPSPT